MAPPPERPFVEEVGAAPGRLRVALVLEPPHPSPVDTACIEAAHDAAALLAELGHEVEEVAPPWRSEELIDLFAVLWQTIPSLYPADAALLEPLNQAFVERAAATSSADVRARLRPPPALRACVRRVLRDASTSCSRRRSPCRLCPSAG